MLTAAGPTVKSRKAYCQPQGGGAFIYVLDKENRAEIIKDLKAKFAATEGVAAVIGTEDFAKHGHLTPDQDPREPDIMLGRRTATPFPERRRATMSFPRARRPRARTVISRRIH